MISSDWWILERNVAAVVCTCKINISANTAIIIVFLIYFSDSRTVELVHEIHTILAAEGSRVIVKK